MKNSFLKLFCKIALIFFTLFSFISNNEAADIGITLKSPENNHHFTLRETRSFSWAPIANQGQRKYIIKLVLVKEGQTPEEAILNNDIWYSDTTDVTSYNGTYYYHPLDNYYLPTYQKIAWQVKAMDINDVVYSQSAVNVFVGPPYMEAFYAGNSYIIYVDTTTVLDMNNLAGKGHMRFREKTINLEYKNLKLKGLTLIEGSISHPYKDTVSLKPLTKEDGNIQFFCDTLFINKDHLYKKGRLQWINNILENDTIISAYTAVALHGYDLQDPVPFPTQISKLNSLSDIKITLNSKSRFYLQEPYYYMRLSGSLEKIYNKQDTINFLFSEASSLFYFPITCDKKFLLNNVFEIKPTNGFLDLSSFESPKSISDPQWKGIYVNKIDLSFNTLNNRNQFKFVSGEKIPFDLELNNKSKLYFTDNSWQLTLDTVFAAPGLGCSYNGFKGNISAININRPYSLNLSNQISGNITIPYFPLPNKVDYVVNLNETAVVDSLVKKVDDFSFNEVSKNSITSFYVFNGDEKIPGVIDETAKTIRFSLPQDADIKKVKSYFTTTGVQVKVKNMDQVRGETINDFSSTLIYSVQSGEGVFENYKVSENLHTANNNIEEGSNIRVYPNPAKNKLYFEGVPTKANIDVYSIDGRLMMQSNYNGTPEIYIDRLTPGLYLLKITSKEGKLNFKFTKE